MRKRIGMLNTVVTIGAILASMAGCTSMDNGRYRYDQGWRFGNIVKIGSATTDFPTAPFDCRRAVPNAGGAEHDYAYVHLANIHERGGKYFNSNSKLRHVIVRLRPGTSLREGDRVRVNIRDCTQFAS